jgi:hypothetical protein
MTPFAHPLWLQRLAFAPCETQTPTPLVSASGSLVSMRDANSALHDHLLQPPWLQVRLFAPCVKQTPANWACLVHPLWLQHQRVLFLSIPCMQQSLPCMAKLAHPSWLQRFYPWSAMVSSFRQLCKSDEAVYRPMWVNSDD